MTSSVNSPEIVAIRDAQENNLLLDPQPLAFDLAGAAKTTILRIQSGPAGPLTVSVRADQPWLRPDQSVLALAAGGVAELVVSAFPEGADEFAVLQFGWQEAGEDLFEHILVWRRRAPSKVTPATAPTPPAPAPLAASGDTSPLPDWMR